MIINPQDLSCLLDDFKQLGKTVVFTNGCFDLIHVGHVRFLKKAKELGDLLVVGLNSDSSVQQIKGSTRPIVPQEDRAEVLSAIRYVDYVVIFDEPDPYKIIELLKPQVLVKGGDWPIDKIVGRDIVESFGGVVKTIAYVDGASTSNIVEEILKRYR